jgi:hypothetical protein
MNDLHDLLERIEVPPTHVDDDVARGERALRRRRGWQISMAAISVVAVTGVGVALSGSAGPSGAVGPGVAGQPGAATSAGTPSAGHHAHPHADQRALPGKQRLQQLRHQLNASSGETLRTYHDVLAEHLDPAGDQLRLAQNEQGGSGSFGTKLDWRDGGMLEIVVGTTWGAAGGFYILEDAGMEPTTYDGQPARVSTSGGDLVVSVEHADGTIVTLIASTEFGNNGTSTASLGLTRHQLLAAAADPRLQLPPYLR